MPIKEVEGDLRPLVSKVLTEYYDFGLTPGYSSFETVEYSGVRVGQRLKRVWVRTDNYKARAKAGTLPDNPFDFEWNQLGSSGDIIMGRTFVSNDGLLKTRETKTVKTDYFVGWEVIPPVTTDEQVITKILQKARSNQWNAPVFIAELGKTSEMIYKRAVQLALMVRDLKRGDFAAFVKGFHPDVRLSKNDIGTYTEVYRKRFRQSPRQAAAGALMEFSYGWMPTVWDMQNAMNTLVDLTEEAKEGRDAGIMRLRAAAFQQFTLLDGVEQVSVTPNLSCHTKKTVREDRRIIWRFRVLPEDIPARVGLVNHLSTIWELTTLSWLVDWVIPVGQYLEGFSDSMRFEHVGGQSSWRQEVKVKRNEWQSSDYSSCRGPNAESSSVRISAGPLSGMPALQLRHLAPQNPNWGPKKAAVALALMSQAFDSLKRS